MFTQVYSLETFWPTIWCVSLLYTPMLTAYLPKQKLVNKQWVLFGYGNKSKNHSTTAIQSMDVCDSKLLC